MGYKQKLSVYFYNEIYPAQQVGYFKTRNVFIIARSIYNAQNIARAKTSIGKQAYKIRAAKGDVSTIPLVKGAVIRTKWSAPFKYDL
jgi:hypothetical protein